MHLVKILCRGAENFSAETCNFAHWPNHAKSTAVGCEDYRCRLTLGWMWVLRQKALFSNNFCSISSSLATVLVFFRLSFVPVEGMPAAACGFETISIIRSATFSERKTRPNCRLQDTHDFCTEMLVPARKHNGRGSKHQIFHQSQRDLCHHDKAYFDIFEYANFHRLYLIRTTTHCRPQWKFSRTHFHSSPSAAVFLQHHPKTAYFERSYEAKAMNHVI